MKAEFNILRARGKNSLAIAGSLTVDASMHFRSQLQQLLSENMPVEISLKELNAIDVSGIQLIRSFAEECMNKGLPINVVPLENKEIINLLALTGLLGVIPG
jgi:ABC-type transporter Mla MlaB component